MRSQLRIRGKGEQPFHAGVVSSGLLCGIHTALTASAAHLPLCRRRGFRSGARLSQCRGNACCHSPSARLDSHTPVDVRGAPSSAPNKAGSRDAIGSPVTGSEHG
ncbi:hypothetical protein NDU88_004030 [Pleurodeles waltl]|uniref:Uncharacterized protein n=1 Tax=Pleurodeles waltl TaxID=8319 RepID=A0AAV7V2E8_PLEWA|nr:hypothetical protein NDU88_004030 [Pleurodeles waltl]